MARTVHRVDYERNAAGPPLVGALLRRPFMAARARIVQELHAAGFLDLTPAHLAVFQYPGPHGRSPGELARAAGASKQAMNNLLAQLERAGYLVRSVNPDNRRERTLELTARGDTVVTTIRAAVSGIERRWRADLGDRDYEQLRALLERLNLVSDVD
jgi:DNA-binding MarR family transcriptional regulator